MLPSNTELNYLLHLQNSACLLEEGSLNCRCLQEQKLQRKEKTKMRKLNLLQGRDSSSFPAGISVCNENESL